MHRIKGYQYCKGPLHAENMCVRSSLWSVHRAVIGQRRHIYYSELSHCGQQKYWGACCTMRLQLSSSAMWCTPAIREFRRHCQTIFKMVPVEKVVLSNCKSLNFGCCQLVEQWSLSPIDCDVISSSWDPGLLVTSRGRCPDAAALYTAYSATWKWIAVKGATFTELCGR